MRANAKEAGYASRTIRRAQQALGIEAVKEGMKGGWAWKLPAKVAKNTEDVQGNSVDAFDNVGHLRAPSDADPDIVEVEI